MDGFKRLPVASATHLSRPRQNAAWVSGFFGSGKSHLLKMLGHLWVNTEFDDGSYARSLVRGLSDEIIALLRELDTQVTRSGHPAAAAAGTLPQGTGEHVRLTVLAIILSSCDLPEQYPQASFCFWLRERGYLDRVRDAVEQAGKDWFQELNALYASPLIANAVLACDANFAKDEREARQVLRAQFPIPSGDITTAQFIKGVRDALAPSGDVPLTMLVLDEAQQYIADSQERATLVTELAEAVQTQLDSRVMLVCSGQSALAGTPLLQKLRDRFRITVQLSDTDVEVVTRKVLLQKKASAVEPIRGVLDRNAGEISKHLQGTKIAERTSDKNIIVEDYPLLPTRRRFWEECFRVVDAAGTRSQLRSQLQILDSALRGIANADLGAVVPADTLFESIAEDLVSNSVLPNELDQRIRKLDDGTDDGKLRKQICGLAFLISKLHREPTADIGVRANARTIADLLVTNLNEDSGPFRKRVAKQLDAMANDGTLMKVGDEYRLQTTQGAEWDRAYREKIGTLNSQRAEIQSLQDQLFAQAVQAVVTKVSIRHGDSKEKRSLVLHARPDSPNIDGDQIVTWMRDGSSVAQKDVESEARRLGHDDPIIHVHLSKPSDELKAKIIEAEAARLVLDIKGSPSEPAEAREACESMKSRLRVAEDARNELIRDLITAAKVYQGGGNEVYGDSLQHKLESAVDASLSRMFPRFNEGDHKAWEAAKKRASDGSDEPLKIVGWDKPTEDHAVVREVLNEIGAGNSGTAIRKKLKAAPFGWPQDAIDTALIALHRAGTIRVMLNGAPVAPGQLDQNKIPKAEFRQEKVRLTTTQKIELRGLMVDAKVPVKAGEEEVKASTFLDTLISLAQNAGGDAPLPPRPATATIDDLRKLTGSEQLGAILDAKVEIQSSINDWTAKQKRIEQRFPQWLILKELARHAAALPIMADVSSEIDAIESNRSLLEDTDYVQPLRKKLEQALRTSLTTAHKAARDIHQREHDALIQSDDWKKLPADKQASIIAANRLEPIPPLDIATEDKLLAALNHRSLAGWAELADGLPTRFAKARADAARELEPKSQPFHVQRATLRNEDEIKAWLSKTQADLLAKLPDGPIIIS